MKQILILLISVISFNCSAQTEFRNNGNTLIYPDSTVKKLKFIVDSLNLKFKVCDLNRTFHAKPQTKGNYLSFSGKNITEAKKDLEANISWDSFLKKYPDVKAESELLIIKFNYKNYKQKPVIEFSSMELNGKFHHSLVFEQNLDRYAVIPKKSWIILYEPASRYSTESLSAFYVTEDFKQNELPATYAKMFQYSECLIDTSTQIFSKKATKSAVYYDGKQTKVDSFDAYISEKTHRPVYHDGDKAYDEKIDLWYSARLSRVDSLQKNDKRFTQLFNAALAEAKEKGNGNDNFEELVAIYHDKETALQLKRNRIVVGACSMDDSPRRHAMNIAKLSAETAKWEIFLRAHLDIMNDRFDRMSDGSYAQAGRKTYIRELEVLDINVLDLLLGISLRVEDASINHYYGSITRLGRALAETKDKAIIEDKMLSTIADNSLDDYNRMLIYYLYLNYNGYLSDKTVQKTNSEKLDLAVKTLPNYLASKLIAAEKGK